MTEQQIRIAVVAFVLGAIPVIIDLKRKHFPRGIMYFFGLMVGRLLLSRKHAKRASR